MLQVEKLCNHLRIGTLTEKPKPIYGGFSHKMYAVTTTQGKYAIKALNPQWMISPSAQQQIILSEQIARIAAKRVSAIPAKIFNHKTIQDIDGQLFLVFDWIDGNNVEYGEITIEHSKIIGGALADIHKTDFSELNLPKDTYEDDIYEDKKQIDWRFYLHRGELDNAVWVDLLKKNIDILYDYYALAVDASNSLATKNVISHRNLDPRNVLWRGFTPYIVDWENAWLVNPYYDFVNTAIHWSNKNKDKFIAFAYGYKSKNKLSGTNWRQVLYKRFIEPLDWLEVCLKRSLKIECDDPDEQQLGTEQVERMINNDVLEYAAQIEEMEKWLNEIESV
ncbi:MAG: aminoglycoside phosphotransferase [Herbinix sp.]|jgi:aminoglycoside phosphotransferase (APT) family kinase protein|nr:aminoglycoside phosphotransferase [Herbinix sp.]